jgi:hypothetical protein
MSALTSPDARQAIYDAQSATLVELGLQRLNDAMGPMLETLTEAAGLGFLVCKAGGISRQLTLGSAIGWVITDGASIFTPTPFLLAQDDTDNTNWGILSIDPGGWVQGSATLATHVLHASKTQASSSDHQRQCRVRPMMQTMLSDPQNARDQAVSANASVAAQMATLSAAITAIQSGPVASVAGKTGAVALVEGDIANLTADLAAKATISAMNTAIGGKQDASAKLTVLAAMTWAANQILMATSAGTISTITVSAFILSLLDDVDASTAQSTFCISAFIKTLLGAADAPTARSTLGITSLGGIVTINDVGPYAFDAQNGAAAIARLNATANRTLIAPLNPADGQKVIIEHTAGGGLARTLALTVGSAGTFRFGTDITALSATAAGKIDRIGVIYNAPAQRWDVTGVVKGF